MPSHHLALSALTLACALPAQAQAQNRIDLIRPDAPELAAYGPLPVGVRTMSFTDSGRADVISSLEADAPVLYDRTLTVEVWYPAAEGTTSGGTYRALIRDGETEVDLEGRAVRDAAPGEGSYPLVVVSHGYPGNRFLMAHLGENLASKGYVTASIDHPDSTYDDQTAFPSTLVNRPLDQAFAIEALTGLDDAVGALIDDARVGVIGYSMGGYGALILAGGGLSPEAIERTEPSFFVAPHGLLAQHAAGSDTHEALQDERIGAVVAIGPWGRNRGFWDAEGLSGIEAPLMVVGGSVDDVSVYENIRDIFEEASGTNRLLLTYEGANHNAGAPMPAPAESWTVSETLGWAPFEHYGDAVWDSVRMNNVLAHFVTAFMDTHLKDDAEAAAYLDLVEEAAAGVVDRAEDGTENAGHSYWKGFPDRSAVGLRLERRAAGE